METQTIVEAAFPWLTLLILIAAVASLVLCIVRPLRSHAREFALGVSLLILVLYAVALGTNFNCAAGAETQLAETYPWIPALGASIAWGVNGMGAVMVGLAVFLVPVVVLAGWDDFEPEQRGGYFGWILFLEAIMIALFAARDVFLFYVLFELMIVPMYFLIGRYGGAGREHAAMKFLLYSILGGLIMLVGVIGLYVMGPGGAQNYLLYVLQSAPNLSGGVEMLFFLSFFIGFAIKAPMWPVHTWLPDTAEHAPAGTSTLLVGVLDKLGTFGMIAICVPLFPHAAAQAAPVIIVLAVVSIFWGALMAIASDNLMRLVAYTSVSHFGFMVMGIFSGSALALSGAILYMVAHGVGTAGLFLIVGFLGRRGGSYLISHYGGWQRVTPVLAGTFLIAGLATIALPGLSGFVPEYLVLMGTFKVNMVAALFAVVGVVLAAVYILLPYQRAFTGPKPEDVEVKDLNAREKTVVGVLIAAMLVLGFFPTPVLGAVNPVADDTATVLVAEAGSAGAATFDTAASEGSNE
ncbi:MAG: NADH-quinone oxidoreductase subunit M [Actinomycetaceae bacterium]|nr:NADH-quinone oxidoreductase subunit M [Arcanobacterium sp.]MDD7686967.1 NADH-quinone oxidoreductase subunit M [Actinomycetaceae bacterium]MDY5273378.1 NADH-quinone oxidoreductase subunit M [Arcanobacterium sp.]